MWWSTACPYFIQASPTVLAPTYIPLSSFRNLGFSFHAEGAMKEFVYSMISLGGFRWTTADQIETHSMDHHQEYTMLLPH